jgi:hypothetical protein
MSKRHVDIKSEMDPSDQLELDEREDEPQEAEGEEKSVKVRLENFNIFDESIIESRKC